MRFDLFHELAVPKFMGYSERDVHRQTLDEIAFADEAGFDGVWLVEHHFQPEFSHCPAPEVLFGAISQRTKRIRIGHGVVLLPFNHPVRVAERIAVLDIISDGRMDVGVGRGFSPLEYDVFGGTMDQSRGKVDEGLEIMRRAWGDEPFSFDGQHWSFPEIEVVPKPVQKPPKLWTAAVSPETYIMGAEQGLGVLAGPFKPLFMVAEDRERFVTRCHEVGRDPAELGFGMTVGAVVLDDHKRAMRVAEENVRWFYQQLLKLTAPVLERGGQSYQYYREELGTLRALTGGSPSIEALQAAGMVVAGDPEHVIEQLRNLADHGVDHVLLSLQAGGVPHEDVLRSIELFGEQVIPALRGVSAADRNGKPKRRDMSIFVREAPDLTPDLLFESMPLVFRRDRANGLRALYEVALAGERGGTWWIDVADGECRVLRDQPDSDPDVRIRSDAETWLALAKGDRNPAGALLRRRLRIRGNPRKAAHFMNLFQ
jgi:alkanesulfonate monooxygenase SsuD/methylene tetrahydromethanopterin reductase-like flavin-dependent oxidoreductase (luciferase family)